MLLELNAVLLAQENGRNLCIHCCWGLHFLAGQQQEIFVKAYYKNTALFLDG